MKTNIHFWSYLAEVVLKWEMFPAKKKHTLCSIIFFFENHAVCEIMWKNIAKPDRPQMTTWRMCFECWISKSTNTHLEYAILIVFLLQQCLHERSSTLPCTYTACCFLYYKVKDGSEAPQLRTQCVPWILSGDKFFGAWGWSLTSVWCRDWRWVELYFCSLCIPSWHGQGRLLRIYIYMKKVNKEQETSVNFTCVCCNINLELAPISCNYIGNP